MGEGAYNKILDTNIANLEKDRARQLEKGESTAATDVKIARLNLVKQMGGNATPEAIQTGLRDSFAGVVAGFGSILQKSRDIGTTLAVGDPTLTQLTDTQFGKGSAEYVRNMFSAALTY